MQLLDKCLAERGLWRHSTYGSQDSIVGGKGIIARALMFSPMHLYVRQSETTSQIRCACADWAAAATGGARERGAYSPVTCPNQPLLGRRKSVIVIEFSQSNWESSNCFHFLINLTSKGYLFVGSRQPYLVAFSVYPDVYA